MSLRKQLLLISLLTLTLPWAAYRYVQEMEGALRAGLAGSLADSAAAIATALSERPDLLYPGEMHFGRTPDGDIYAHPITAPVDLDGYIDDWSLPDDVTRLLPGVAGDRSLRYAAGTDAQFVYLYLDARDDWVVYADAEQAENGDRVYLALESPAGGIRRLVLSTAAPGRLLARELGEDTGPDLRIEGQWQPTPGGFHLELRIPQRLQGRRLGFTWVDVDGGSGGPGAIGTITGATAAAPTTGEAAALIRRPPALAQQLAAMEQAGKRLRVVDMHRWVVGQTGALAQLRRDTRRSVRDRIYRALLDPNFPAYPARGEHAGQLAESLVAEALSGEPQTRWHQEPYATVAVVTASAPIRFGGRDIGAVVLEQSSDAILLLANNALTRLLGVTLIAFGLAAVGLLGFATWLSLRIRRLSHAADSAILPDGRIVASLPGMAARDEIGDLSRSFGSLLARLQEYTDYLRTLASKLSHELRTPLAVVRSSLENLDAQELDESAKVYARRARDGSQRLQRILGAMSEATRVEESVRGAKPESFDLATLLGQATRAYRDLHKACRFDTDIPDTECPITASPDLLVQMLDKLIDNAVDFTPESGRIGVSLRRLRGGYRLGVANEGPPLPDTMQGQLFDSMVSVRERRGDTPHMGFGLYIVRLIVDAHHGTIVARNIEGGVEFIVTLPE